MALDDPGVDLLRIRREVGAPWAVAAVAAGGEVGAPQRPCVRGHEAGTAVDLAIDAQEQVAVAGGLAAGAAAASGQEDERDDGERAVHGNLRGERSLPKLRRR